MVESRSEVKLKRMDSWKPTSVDIANTYHHPLLVKQTVKDNFIEQ
jgi:hypothetical protein